MILQNEIKCEKCGSQIWSAHRHDFKWCSCGAVAVDGGMSYLRRVGGCFIDKSITIDDVAGGECIDAIERAIDTGRNPLGVLAAVARTLRDRGYEIRRVYDSLVKDEVD